VRKGSVLLAGFLSLAQIARRASPAAGFQQRATTRAETGSEAASRVRRARVGALVMTLALTASGEAKDESQSRVREVPCASDLTAPPRVCVGPDACARVALAVAEGIDVVSSGRPDAAFGEPVHAVRRGDLLVGARRGPRIAATRSTVVLAAISRWTKDGGGDLLAWRSSDGGATWSDAVRVSDVPGCAREGLFDLAALGDGRFAAVWLDVREKGTRLCADFSADGAAWGADVIAYRSPDGSICECCHPEITPADRGAVVAFRNSVGGDRDVWTTRLAAGATAFEPATKSGKGSWRLAACPMAGPAVATKGDDVVSAWRREGHVFLAAAAGSERDLGEGTEPQLFTDERGVHALWIAKGALVHLAPGALAPETIAIGAAFPCTARAAMPGWTGLVAWLDTATKRPRCALVN
jgi:hypothetical protein